MQHKAEREAEQAGKKAPEAAPVNTGPIAQFVEGFQWDAAKCE